jgi:hypothetical protein
LVAVRAAQRRAGSQERIGERAFDPDEPRDESGKWTDGGGDGGGGKDKPEGGGDKKHPGPCEQSVTINLLNDERRRARVTCMPNIFR